MIPHNSPALYKLKFLWRLAVLFPLTFYEKIPGVEHYQRRSNDVKNSIIQACSELASFKAIARSHGVSVSTVIRYFDGLTFKRPLHLPEVLSLDEFRGNAHGQRYQVAVNDPQRHETLDCQGRVQFDPFGRLKVTQ